VVDDTYRTYILGIEFKQLREIRSRRLRSRPVITADFIDKDCPVGGESLYMKMAGDLAPRNETSAQISVDMQSTFHRMDPNRSNFGVAGPLALDIHTTLSSQVR